jgi:hypothetical protein
MHTVIPNFGSFWFIVFGYPTEHIHSWRVFCSSRSEQNTFRFPAVDYFRTDMGLPVLEVVTDGGIQKLHDAAKSICF